MKTFVRLSFLVLLVAALPALAQDWSAVGSVGHPDESSLTLYSVNGPDLEFLPGATGSIFARYQVTNTYGSATSFTPPWGRLIMGYRDNGNQVTIHARLMRLDLCSNTVTQLCEIKSTDSTSSHCDVCAITQALNFQNYAYYVEVDLNRSSTSGVAIVHHVGLQ
jgi:hypothetical protein